MSYTRKSIQQMINELHGVTPTTLSSVSETLNSYMGKSPNELNLQRYFNRILGKRDTEYSEQQALFEILKGPLSLTGTYTQYNMQDLVYRMVNANITLDMLPIIGIDFDDLSGYWPLKETFGTTAHDYSSGNHDATITGATVGQPGKVGKAMAFDGVNDYATLDGLTIPTSALTLGFLIKRVGAQQDSDRVFSWADAGPTNGIDIKIQSNNTMLLQFWNSTAGPAQVQIFSSALNNNEWYLFTFTSEPNNTKMFINGVQSGATDTSNTLLSASQTPTLMKASNASTNYATGSLQHVFFFDIALTESQIQNIAKLMGVYSG